MAHKEDVEVGSSNNLFLLSGKIKILGIGIEIQLKKIVYLNTYSSRNKKPVIIQPPTIKS